MKTENSLTTTIIGGKFKGRKILLPSLDVTRSSKSILRGSLFDTLQFDIMENVFVEAFAGSGSIGIEALSRGARKVYFIEKDNNSYSILKKNILQIEPQKSISIHGDTFVELDGVIKELKRNGEQAYFYFDPPFNIRENQEDIYEKSLNLIETIPTDVVILIVIEHFTKVKMPENIGTYKLKKTKKFGKSSLSYYEYEI
ncbi:MAG: 16S rRNA (guanine(966)-N(2))-methyltransferase RsmD [Campylobacterales bacterium]|nr:16S rRNA (guanine(966)-N(2))-methyltransferase RsmD [Campylobacterales bacterium]